METGFAIFINSVAEGAVPIVYNEDGEPFVFSSQLEAQREIADNTIIRLYEFIKGSREFEDAISVEEYVLEVAVSADGSIRILS